MKVSLYEMLTLKELEYVNALLRTLSLHEFEFHTRLMHNQSKIRVILILHWWEFSILIF